MRSIIAATAIFTIAISSCHSIKKTTGRSVVLDTLSVSANNNPYNIVRASATRLWQIDTTILALGFDLPAKTAKGTAHLKLHPYFYDQDSLVLDAKSMKIEAVQLVTATAAPVKLPFSYAGDTMVVKLGKKYSSNESLHLVIDYVAMPYEKGAGGSSAITEDRGLYFINTDHKIPGKPVQIWSQGESESNSHWFPTIDKPNSRSSFQISLTVPDSFVTLSNGLKIASEKKGNLRTDVWQMKMPIQVYAAMIAVGNFAKTDDKSWNGKEVSYYTEPAYQPYAKLIFQHTPEMMEYFSNITGIPFAWDKYSQVIVRDYVSGAMENTSASLFGEFVNQNAREHADRDYEDIVSHELFHQWFGDYVTFKSWSNLTVSESFANYGEYLWRKHYYGDESADELHYADLTKYLLSSEDNDPSLLRYHYTEREDMFDRISYEKGGATLHFMHSLMGDAAFSRSMKNYLTDNALQSAEADNWRMAVEKATGQDWKWFFDQWYVRAGHPELDLTYQYKNDSLYVTVKQTQADTALPYYLPLKAALVYGNEKTIINWLVSKKKEVFVYPYKNGVKPVFIGDVTHIMPGKLTDHKDVAGCRAQYANSMGDYIDRVKSVAIAFNTFGDADDTKQLLHEAIEDPNASVRVMIVRYLGRSTKDGIKEGWTDKLMQLAQSDKNAAVRGAAINTLGKWNVTKAQQLIETAISDSSYTVAGYALNALHRLDSVKAHTIAIGLWNSNPRSILQDEVWSITAKQGTDADFALFQQQANKISGRENFSFTEYLAVLMHKLSTDALYEQGLQLLGDVIARENIEAYRESLLETLFAEITYYKKNDKTKAKTRLPIATQYAKAFIAAEPDESMRKKLQKKLDEAEK